MPTIKTINGSTLDFRFETAVPRGSESPFVIVRVTPEGNEVTEDQAKATCSMYPFVVISSNPTASPAPEQEAVNDGPLVCLEHDKVYKTQKGFDQHMEVYH